MNFKSKRKLSLLLALFTLLSVLCSCGKQGNSGKSLREHGLDVVSLMDEMVKNEDYGSFFVDSGNSELNEIREKLAGGDYTTLKDVYEISIPSIQELLSYVGEEGKMDGLPDSLKRFLNGRSASTLISQLNAQEGTSVLAMTSVYTGGKTFVYSDLKANTLYLYTFRDGYPIAVSFTVGEDGAVTASGSFLLNESFREASLEQINELFGTLGISCSIKLLGN